MFLKNRFNLQMFADGAFASGNAPAAGENGGASATAVAPDLPSPSRRKAKQDPLDNVVYGKQANAETSDNTSIDNSATENSDTTQKNADMSFDELIKSDKYKAEYQQSIENVLNQRLKKYKGMETQLDSVKPLLEIAGTKYGLDPSSKSFVEDLQNAMNTDNSYFETYATDHGCSVDEARRILSLEHQVNTLEQQKQERERQEQFEKDWKSVLEQSERTKAKFPNFNLETEMLNERFAKLVATGIDTTAAFIATHHDSIIPATVQMATEKATQQVANSVQANKSRPVENGLSSQSAAIIKDDPSKFTLKDFRKIRDNFRKTGERPIF